MNVFLFCLASPSVFQPDWPFLPFYPKGFCCLFPAVICSVLCGLCGSSSEDLIGLYLCPFHHLLRDQNSLCFLFFFPVIFAYYAVAVFHVAILNCYTDHPEQGKNPAVLTVILCLQCKIGELAGLETPCSKSPGSFWGILATVIIVTVSNLK